MDMHLLGDSGIVVSAMCLGTAGFGTAVRRETADSLLATFVDAGGNFVDTAHCYAFWEPDGLGASERELGATIRRLGLSGAIVVATKGGHPDGGDDYRRPDGYLSPEVIHRDIVESLERLRMDSIDVYYLHRDDSRVPVDEIIESLNEHVSAGRIVALGASNWSVRRIEAANAYAVANGLRGFVVSEVQWSLAQPTWSPTDDPTTRYVTRPDAGWYFYAGMPIVAYSATAGGYFAGRGEGGGLYETPENAERRRRAAGLASDHGWTANQVALAWLMHQAPTVIPLFGTHDVEHLAEAVAAVDIHLSEADADYLTQTSPIASL